MREIKSIGVVGLGYVGLTLAVVLAEAGFKVVGIERRQEFLEKIINHRAPFKELGLENIIKTVSESGNFFASETFDNFASCDAYIISVGTPLGENGRVNSSMIELATNQIANHMNDGALIIVRSTVKIGTTRNLINKILDESGKKYFLAVCPERTLEGRALAELKIIPQIIGADDVHSKAMAGNIFGRLKSSIINVSSWEAAEFIKLIDNSFRDVQFGFANELALMSDRLGLNATEIINSANFEYERTNIPVPGLVGGPCLEKDPHILAESLELLKVRPEIIVAARRVNEQTPSVSIEFISSKLKMRKSIGQLKFCILGIAFKGQPETDDIRGSMALKIFSLLNENYPGSKFSIYDPAVLASDIDQTLDIGIGVDDINKAIQDSDVVLICNNNKKFSDLDLIEVKSFMKEDGIIYDFWNLFNDKKVKKYNRFYFSLGNIAGV